MNRAVAILFCALVLAGCATTSKVIREPVQLGPSESLVPFTGKQLGTDPQTTYENFAVHKATTLDHYLVQGYLVDDKQLQEYMENSGAPGLFDQAHRASYINGVGSLIFALGGAVFCYYALDAGLGTLFRTKGPNDPINDTRPLAIWGGVFASGGALMAFSSWYRGDALDIFNDRLKKRLELN